jgi:hypothetical protein
LVTCPPGGSASRLTLALGGGLGTVTGLTAACSIDAANGTTSMNASISAANLFGGRLVIRGIHCSASAGPTGTMTTSSIGSLDGKLIGSQPASFVLPGIGSVYLNQTTINSSGLPTRNTVVLMTGTGSTTQRIVLASCGYT